MRLYLSNGEMEVPINNNLGFLRIPGIAFFFILNLEFLEICHQLGYKNIFDCGMLKSFVCRKFLIFMQKVIDRWSYVSTRSSLSDELDAVSMLKISIDNNDYAR